MICFLYSQQVTTCFSKIFNECPLHIYCTGLWVNPNTRGINDRYVGIFIDKNYAKHKFVEILEIIVFYYYCIKQNFSKNLR